MWPHDTDAETILASRPRGVLLCNGPGDPSVLEAEVAVVRELLGRLPMLGICLGHQLLARAAGFETFKLPFGHRGANHPVLELATSRVLVTSQNHGFAVRGDAAAVTHVSLYDGTVEGIALPEKHARSLQFHPEAGPGPHDAWPEIEAWVDELGYAAAASRSPDEALRSQSICVIGAGPIVIGQACEFDYSGSQALKVLRAEGYRTIVVNSNPATIMTDPGFADRDLPRAARCRGPDRRPRA